MKMTNRIALLFPYFGSLPNTFEYWLNTIAPNQRFDIFIFTDRVVNCSFPNIKVVRMTFDDFADTVQQNFTTEIKLKTPYKICDYRPMFGEIFRRELTAYEFWGYGDLDVIWGNLDTFITDGILEKYDRISQFGHLSIYRNCERMNTLYRQTINGEKPYLNAIKSEKNVTFDEWWNGYGIEHLAKHYCINEFRELKLADVSRIYKRRQMCFEFEINGEKLSDATERVFRYESGHLYDVLIKNKQEITGHEEVAYAHFQKRRLTVPKEFKNDFWIVPNKIILEDFSSVKNYLNSEEYIAEYMAEKEKFVAFRKKYPDVF